jgi:NAD(P)H dehydrogenase (quinone)
MMTSSSEPARALDASRRRWRRFWTRRAACGCAARCTGRVGGAFSASGTQHGGQEATLFSIIANMLHFGMLIVGLDYGHTGQMTLDEITGGSPYGATTITGADGSRQPSANELQGARYQGRRITEVANKLYG